MRIQQFGSDFHSRKLWVHMQLRLCAELERTPFDSNSPNLKVQFTLSLVPLAST